MRLRRDMQPTRRQMLRTFANGFGMVGVASLLSRDVFADPAPSANRISPAPSNANPLSIKPPMFPARAKRVIFLFMSGGPSHVDLFDPKPKLVDYAGKP